MKPMKIFCGIISLLSMIFFLSGCSLFDNPGSANDVPLSANPASPVLEQAQSNIAPSIHQAKAVAPIPITKLPTPILGIIISLDLTGAGIKSVQKVPGSSSAVPGTVHVINGSYYILPKKTQLLLYKNSYFLVPSTTKFNYIYYGHFGGPGWGYSKDGSGNSKLTPISDGGLDAACKAHDVAWANNKAVQGNIDFLASLQNIKPKWFYEEAYIKGAISWVKDRIKRNDTSTVVSYSEGISLWRSIGDYTDIVLSKSVN